MKAKPMFIYFLAIVSILGFMGTAVDAFGGIDISKYITSTIFLLIGIGLMIEGNVRALPKMLKYGLTGNEISHITAIAVGVVAIISGVLSYPFIGIENNTFTIIKGILSIVAIVIIVIETFFVK